MCGYDSRGTRFASLNRTKSKSSKTSLNLAVKINIILAIHLSLAVQNSSIGDLVPWSTGLTELTIRVFTSLQSDPTHLWPLWHLIRVTRRHDLTWKISDFLKKSDFLKIFDFLKEFRFPENFRFSDFWKKFRFLEKFQSNPDMRLDTWDTDYISDNWGYQY